MSFLQPWLLVGLPLVSLPIIIHLINQRRFQTVRWAAMMFLLAANRMSRGYSRLRQWLIMLFRMLVVAGLIFAISRPLASGWLGLAAGSRADTTIILLDRSPSMQQKGQGTGSSKLETGCHQLAQTLSTLGSARWVLIESTANKPLDLESPEALLNLPSVEPASSSADVPGMMQAAYDYIKANQAGQTEIWICSDIRANDWNAESGRWKTLRDAFAELPQGTRFHLLAYPRKSTSNVAVRVTDVRRQATSDGAELLVSLLISRDGEAEGNLSIPVEFDIEGARSTINVDIAGPRFELKDHRIPVETGRQRGWGRVSIPADENPADDDFYFVFDKPFPRRTIIVADDPQSERPLQLASSIPPDPALNCTAETITREQLGAVEWEGISLVLWQTQLPDEEDARAVEEFVDRGGQVIFLPPKEPGDQELFGVRWQRWIQGTEDVPVETWRGDQDVLAHALSGTALPVGALQVRKYCGLSGEMTSLATLRGGAPLLARVPTKRGGVYLCATTSDPSDSSLASNGVVLYVLIHRALAAGASVLGSTRQLAAGDELPPGEAVSWTRVAGAKEGLSTEFRYHRGVYSTDEKLLAVNRPPLEDQAIVLGNPRVDELFKGLDFARVDDQAGNASSLIQEIWRLFLVTMMIAMLAEAALCLPKPVRPTGAIA